MLKVIFLFIDGVEKIFVRRLSLSLINFFLVVKYWELKLIVKLVMLKGFVNDYVIFDMF